MASPKAGFGLPARPSDGVRERRAEEAKLLASVPRSTIRTAEKEAETPRPSKQSPSQCRLPSRVPLPSSTRRPSIPQPTLKPVPEHQSEPRGSMTISSGYSRSHMQNAAVSSSWSRPYDDNSRPAQHVLRRKKSSISQEAGSPRNDSCSLDPSSLRRHAREMVDSALGIQHDREISESPREIQMEESVEKHRSTAQFPVPYPELDRYRSYERPQNTFGRQHPDVPYLLTTHDLPPSTPGSLFFSANSSQISAVSGSPSTKFFDSPGPGPYSRDTTPTSTSSQSPGLIVTSRFPLPKTRQHSPSLTRPPVTRRRTSISNEVDLISVDPHGLAAVRESLASSSSNSTVREGDPASKKGRDTGKVESSPKKRSPTAKRASPDVSLQFKSTAQPRPWPVSSPKAMRPTRDGTADLKSQLFSPVPIIQSNLVSRSPRTERRGSESTIPNPQTPASQSTQANSSASTSNLSVREGVPRSGELKDLKKLNVANSPPSSGTTSPSIGSSFNSRFPFFGRKKTVVGSIQDDTTEKKKSTRKGPAAGTGHEGYGRIGAVRRRSGTVATSPRAFGETRLSQESLISDDPFLADRINPVIIAGGEVIENRNSSSDLSGTESNQSPAYSRKVNLVMSPASINDSRTTLLPSAIPRGPNPAPNSRQPPDSSDSNGVTTRSTIAFRRSVQRLRSSPENPLRLPQPINTSGADSSPMTSFDTSIMSEESSLFDVQPLVSHESSNVQSTPQKLKKARSPRKWSLFSRLQSQPASDTKKEKVTVAVRPVEKKHVAFYAIMDSPEQQEAEPADIQKILRHAIVYPHLQSKFSNPELQSSESRAPDISQPVRHHKNATAEIPAARRDAPLPTGVTLGPGRPIRLPRVGRIPQVVSNRLEKASPRSFSRPFGANLQPLVRAPDDCDLDSSAKVQSLSKPSTPVTNLSRDGSTTDCATEFPFYSESDSHFSPESPAVNEFIAFSPRKNSNCTTGTSSNSSGTYSYVGATAIIPKPDDPPVEDEVWDEYNDILGDDNLKGRQSATSSGGIPFHLETYVMRSMEGKPAEPLTLVTDDWKVSTYSQSPTNSPNVSTDVAERNRAASLPASDDAKHDIPDIRHSTSSSHKARQSGSSSSSGEGSPLAQVNLRVGSMSVSKWLTFGHVLFSNIRHELVGGKDSLERPSILVIDGLGNDDWSFYAAETYPAANFFNLSPRAPLPAESQNSPSGHSLSPPNHHQIQYLSHLGEFPFTPQSFTCVVYRFPAAAPEAHYRNILSEACRVLQPGGYIELSILDVDLNNMGSQGRRTVRQLKERIHKKLPETNLASTADLMVRLLGRGGFSAIKAARVGVPVASSITRSDSDGTRDENSEEKKKKRKCRSSLAEMMMDNGPMADEGITSMVARVGRWWYSGCYENAAGSLTGKSIWNDRALLRECEELGTSLKLMVCCARAPEPINSV